MISFSILLENIPRRIIICGTGSIGRRYCSILEQLDPGTDIRFLSSSSQEIQPFQTYSYDQIEDVFSWDPQAAIICTPAPTHLSIGLQFLSRSVPTLIEKPLCTKDTSKDQIEKSLSLSKACPLLVGYTLRFSKGHQKLLECIKEYDLGSLIELDFYCGSYLPHWRPEQDYKDTVSSQKDLGGGVVYELSHGIDLVNSVAGKHELLYSYTFNSSTLKVDVEDSMIIAAKSKYSPLTTVRQNFCTQPPSRLMTLRYSYGQLQWDLVNQLITLMRPNADKVLFEVKQERNEMFGAMLHHFFDMIHHKCKSKCSINDAMNVMQIIDKIDF